MKDITANHKNKPTATYWWWQENDVEQKAKLSQCAEFLLFLRQDHVYYTLKKLVLAKTFDKKWWTILALILKMYAPLPVVVGKAVVQGGRQYSVCGLSFEHCRGRTIAYDLKKILDVR